MIDKSDHSYSGRVGTASQAVASALRECLAVARVTVRLLDDSGAQRLVAEALAEGEPSMFDGPPPNPSGPSATYLALRRERRIIVQQDCAVADPPPPSGLITYYGVRAQMIAPLVFAGEFAGVISVHNTGRTREWAKEEVDALVVAKERLERVLLESQEYL